MSITETIGMFWVILSTGLVTAASLIVLVWALVVGVRQVMEWVRLGRAAEEKDREFERIIKS